MKNSNESPVYAQVAYDIAAKIAAGTLKEGERFSGRSLMGPQYGVSPETIRRAMRLLAEMNIVEVRQNVGYVVLSRKRSLEYVEQYKADNDLRMLKHRLKKLVEERDNLDREINAVFSRITDMEERFWHSGKIRTYEFTVPAGSKSAGRSIGTLKFRQLTQGTIVAVQKGEEVLLSPDPETVLCDGDILVVACNVGDISRVNELLEEK